MARIRRTRPTASRSILGKALVMFLAITCLFALAATATASPDSHSSSSSSSSPSPKQQQRAGGAGSSSDLICHTDVAAECYPRLFEATDEFQRVHEDQELPAGLHIRLDINSGVREAKLNNASEELPAGLAGLPVDNGIVLVDKVVPVPKGAPAYDPVGLVKDPGTVGGGGGDDGSGAITFHDAIALVKGVAVGQVSSGRINLSEAERAGFAVALDQINEIAHDIYYGLKLAEDHDVTRQLLCLMSGGSAGGSGSDLVAAQKAAAAVGAAVQNNPTALREIEQQWETYKKSVCVVAPGGTAAGAMTLGEVVFGPYHHRHHHDVTGEAADVSHHAAWIRSRLLAINGLIKDDVIMKDFLAGGGLTEVLRLLVEHEGNPAYDAVRQRAANLVIDNFLDASMGADVSLWPKQLRGVAAAAAQEKPCGDGADGQVHAHCWNHHIQQLAKTHKKDKAHWAHELQQRLQEREGGAAGGKTVKHTEL